MYIKAEARARVHSAGLRSASNWFLNTEPRASTSSCGSSRMTLMDGKPLLCGESCMNSTNSTTPAAPSAAVDR